MNNWSRIVLFLLIALLAFWFAVANSREVVAVDLLLFRITISLPLVVLGSILVGMVAVFVVGLRADLRTRRMLERYRDVIHGKEPTLEVSDLSSEEERSGGRARLESLDLS